ncbi:MAG TPA: enoyl-CoA hydratase-related protein [Vicinamibacterales bacterium]|nr:enoyl-CoA hydratase-related protein [Vicinamibacterales bacterium]
MADCLTLRLEGPVARLTLDRPAVRNALDESLVSALTAAARELAARDDVRVAVLAGSGRTFCAGADVHWLSRTAGYSFSRNLEDAAELAKMFEALNNLPIPLVARIQGAALGGGAGLAAVCDVVIAADDAVFGFTEVKLGIMPAVISPYVLRKIGESAARELFLTGERFSAARAREIGLVHRLVPAAALDEAVASCVRELLTSAPSAIAAAKALIARVRDEDPADVIGVTTDAIARQRASADGQEGLRAFLEKRKPRWVP